MKEILCPHCEEDMLKLMPEDLPWDIEYYMCPSCDSTYTTWYFDKESKLQGSVE